MTPREKYKLVVKILWWLKVPEVVVTIAIVLGFILFGFGLVPMYVPLFAFCTRLVLFPVRILIVGEKRKIEKTLVIPKQRQANYVYKYK